MSFLLRWHLAKDLKQKILKIILYVCLVVTHINSHADVYTWVDEKGVRHYSDQKKEGIKNPKEISEKLKTVVNQVKFEPIVNQEFYKEPEKNTLFRPEIKFELDGYELSENLRNHIDINISAIYQYYSEWFGWKPQPNAVISIKIFAEYKDFEIYQLRHNNREVNENSHYSPKRNEIVMVASRSTESTLRTIFHESSHAIINMESKMMPLWINEGLAEVFKYTKVHDEQFSVSKNRRKMITLQEQLRNGTLKSIESYLDISNYEWLSESKKVKRDYYKLAWSMMKFLMQSSEGKDALRKIIHFEKTADNLKLNFANRNPISRHIALSKVFSNNYPGGVEALDEEWRSWIKNYN
jgi:hypothetical protein